MSTEFKSFMSNNKELGSWILRDILNLREFELVTLKFCKIKFYILKLQNLIIRLLYYYGEKLINEKFGILL